MEEKINESFSTKKGLRQSCSLSPILFAISLVDLNEQIAKGQTGGAKKIYRPYQTCRNNRNAEKMRKVPRTTKKNKVLTSLKR